MFATELFTQPTAMKPKASQPADPSPETAPHRTDPAQGKSPSRSRARKFQYGAGDRPLDGYTIKRGVGHGGFGEVYFATSDAGKEVALKLIRRNLDIELRGVRQCLNLKHPNLIALYDIRTDDVDDEWVVMEYVAGESLEEALDRNPNGLPVDEALAWFRGIAAGVAYLHQSGIVHRDLKPGNLFLEGTGSPDRSTEVKIGDYGLSKFISASRRSGQTESVGTVHYMAPEIAGGRYGREIDTYALGVILYEMLTGHVPFEGESVGEVLMKHLTAEPDLQGVAEPYRSIVAKALAKDPAARIKSVAEMVALLPGSEASAPIAEAPPVLDPVWTPVSRAPHTDHPGPPREPLWQAMVELIDTTRARWTAWTAPEPLKALVMLVAIGAVVFSGAIVWVPMTILPFYIVYYIVWALFLQSPQAAAPASRATGAATVAYEPDKPKPNGRRKRPFGWREAARKRVQGRSLRERVRLLIGSMVMAGLIASGVSAVAATLLVNGDVSDPWPLGVGLAALTTLGAWGVLLTNTLTEGRVEDRAPIRGLQLVVGLGLGFAAYGLTQALGPALPFATDIGLQRGDCVLNEMFHIDLYREAEGAGRSVAVPLKASVAYFGLLLLVVRWWKGAEFIRRNRIGFWPVVGAMAGAWLVGFFTWYPQPIGMVVAGTIALAVQAASPWLPPSERAALAHRVAVTS